MINDDIYVENETPRKPQKNFIAENIQKLRYQKPVQGNFKVSTDGFNRPNSMLANFRRRQSKQKQNIYTKGFSFKNQSVRGSSANGQGDNLISIDDHLKMMPFSP